MRALKKHQNPAQGDKSNARAWLGRVASFEIGQLVGRAAADLMRDLDQR